MRLRSYRAGVLALMLAVSLVSCNKGPGEAAAPKGPAAVDARRLLSADSEPGNWMTHGRTYSEQRFSPLDKINADNVEELGLAWYFDLDSHRGQESTPLVIDGVMYVTSAWSKVKALDAATGAAVWEYDPQVPGAWAVNACCDVVNRGAAAWNGKIFSGTLDGRLIALDAKTGKLVWEVQTTDTTKPYTITGAPRVVKGMVVIGNGGADFGVRGYVTAYDSETGKQVWRFYTVPGNPADGFENKQMAEAAKTWHGEWWKAGGGGTVWDAIVYDPVTDLLYLGVGNGSPWNTRVRSPGGGDNLYLSSIVAINPDNGAYVWHFQETPGESWDYTATQPIMTADLMIGGVKRHVLMQAPKNGFFFVLDAKTGALISAKPYSEVTWATGYDLTTGRPIENPLARYAGRGEVEIKPGPAGAHNWQPWAFNPTTGLVYIPVSLGSFTYTDDPKFQHLAKATNWGVQQNDAPLPPPGSKDRAEIEAGMKSALLAWDPVKQEARWRVEHVGSFQGGTVTTAGNLVFEGLANGAFEAYRADTGEKLWSFPAQTGIMAGPITYVVGDDQYVAVEVGPGGANGLLAGELVYANGLAARNISRILAFKLGSNGYLPDPPPLPERVLDPPPSTASFEVLTHGQAVYGRYCAVCHGPGAAAGALVPDLRCSARLKDDGWFAIVLEGVLEENGMANFGDVLSHEDAADIREYVIKQANDARAQQAVPDVAQ